MNKEKLQEPSPRPRVLDELMHDVVHQLKFISQVRAALIDSGEGKNPNKPDQKEPPGVRNRLWDENGKTIKGRVEDGDLPALLTAEYEACTTNWDRLRVIQKAQKHLRRQRYSVDEMAKYKGTMEWKIAVATDERDSATVARVYRCSASYVRTLRHRLRDAELLPPSSI